MKRIVYLFLVYCGSTLYVQSQSACSYKQEISQSQATLTQTDWDNMNRYDVFYYQLDLELQNFNVFVKGNVTMSAKVLSDISEITLQLHPNMIIDSIRLNGVNATSTRLDDVFKVQTNGVLTSGTYFELITYYHGNATLEGTSAIGNGYSNIVAKQVSWSLSEPNAAYEWWPCKQVLTDKADSSEVWVTTDSVNKVGSNGVLQNITSKPNGKVRYEWKSKHPIAYYLISVAVCPYQEYNFYAHPEGSDSVLIQNYVYKDLDSIFFHVIESTAPIMELFSQKFGLYPFEDEKYGHCQSEMGGGMEHQTMSTMGYFNFSIIAHELGHQWFGDYVTNSSWSDIWLHEGFATFCEYVADEELMPAETQNWVNQYMNMAKSTANSVYVEDTMNVSRVFDSYSTYAKGGILLRMLRYEINNDSLFFLGIRNYLTAFQYNNVTANDFKTTMALVSGKNLDVFFDQWYYNPGYPEIAGRWNQWSNRVTVQLSQTPKLTTTIFQTTIDVTLGFNGGDTTIRVWLDSASKIFEFEFNQGEVMYVKVDKGNYILNDLFSVTKDITLSTQVVSSTGFEDVRVYPNPSSHLMTIENAGFCYAAILDITGKLLEEVNIEESSTLDISGYNAGVYFIRLSKEGQTGYLKFVKQ